MGDFGLLPLIRTLVPSPKPDPAFSRGISPLVRKADENFVRSTVFSHRPQTFLVLFAAMFYSTRKDPVQECLERNSLKPRITLPSIRHEHAHGTAAWNAYLTFRRGEFNYLM